MHNHPTPPHPNNNTLTPARNKRFWQVALQRQAGLHLIMEKVHKPHNLGAIARSCDAFGIQHIAYSSNGNSFDAHQKGKETSVSASQWLNYTPFTSTTDYLTKLKEKGYSIAVTAMPNTQGVTSIYEHDFCSYKKLAVVVGNEVMGVSLEALTQADVCITIPMQGMVSSFNVSVATAIILAEITRQGRERKNNFLATPSQAQAYVDYFTKVHQQKRR